jgi:hypothetical protein
MNSQEILDREFLEIRAKILEVAASLDRIQRADGDVSGDRRTKLVEEAISIIASSQEIPNRAEMVQMLFSCEYDGEWMKTFKPAPRT